MSKQNSKDLVIIPSDGEGQDDIPETRNLEAFSNAVNDSSMAARMINKNIDDYPPTKQDRLRVRLMKISGISNEMIASCMGLTYNSLMRKYKQDIRCGNADFTTLVTAKFVECIKDGDVRAIIYHLEKRSGYGQVTVSDETSLEYKVPKEEIEAKLRAYGIDPDTLKDV